MPAVRYATLSAPNDPWKRCCDACVGGLLRLPRPVVRRHTRRVHESPGVMSDQATMAVRWKTRSPRLRSPSTEDCAIASGRAMPLVKTRQAISCGMTTQAFGGDDHVREKDQVESDLESSHVPPQSPEIESCTVVPEGASRSRNACGRPRMKQSRTGW